MRSFAGLLLLLPVVLSAPRDNPSSTTEVQDGQTGTLMVLPPQPTETGLKQIPGKKVPRRARPELRGLVPNLGINLNYRASCLHLLLAQTRRASLSVRQVR
ncbi:hypothetical protein B0H19DRAFT_1078664 [Mycena capillaripes]|nr:hypothetical protein B0H19DRAFT_1078664 [Mycena capillaripes]